MHTSLSEKRMVSVSYTWRFTGNNAIDKSFLEFQDDQVASFTYRNNVKLIIIMGFRLLASWGL